ncbi:MAG TPA: hypothetical protein PKZ84_11975 [Anaerolineae bacterium]|nr:hypothetical protein [Anaerolineae bacterium]HQI85344.1 hypothetical protein [Anaerolineae bacterium]
MNDEFLTHGLPDVRPAFEKALQGKLHSIERRQRRRTHAVVLALVVGLLFSLMLTLPPVRAQMHWLLREIGGFKFVETENPQEDWKAVRDAFSTPTPAPSFDGDYHLEQIVKAFPYVLDAPVWKPDGYAQDEYVNIRQKPEGAIVTVNWHPFACDPCETYISFEIRKMTGGGASTSPAVEGIAGANAETVHFGDKTATLLRFPYTNGSDEIAWAVVWRAEKDGDLFEYHLSSNDPQLTYEDMLKMASTTGFGWYVEKIRQQRGRELPMVNLPEILAVYPELARFLPTWLPEGFTLEEQAAIEPDSQSVLLGWRPGNADHSGRFPIGISMSVGPPFDVPLVVKPDTVKEVTVGNTVAAMWELEFLREHDPDGRTYSLCCLRNDLQYCLSWREPGAVTFDDIVRIVESIPDDARLPAGLEFLDDLR